jgi:Nucleotidyl transferase AbiEii toxin, Type IV TA system
MQPIAHDTAPHIEADLIARLRCTPAWRKFQMIAGLHHGAARIVRMGVRRRRPQASDAAWRYAEAALWFGEDRVAALWPQVKETFRMVDDPIPITLLTADLLESFGISYCLCGALAAMLHGEPRTTRDIDMIADIRTQHVTPLYRALNGIFIVQQSDIVDAIMRREADPNSHASFSMNHANTLFKVDIFLPGRPFDQQQLQRRIAQPVDDESGRALQVASAEDTILAKLEWYQITPSDRQWRDVQAILRVQADALDQAYLRHWAAELSVGDLLEVALRGERPPAPGADPRQQRLF